MINPTEHPRGRRLRSESGSALVVALMAMMLMTALGLSLVLTTSSETILSSNYRTSQEAMYAADAALERATLEFPDVTDLDSLLSGAQRSTFTDGSPGVRTLPNGTTLDLLALTNRNNCGKLTSCSTAEMNAVTADRPWGPNNPRWQLYAYGPINNLLPGGDMASPFYVVVWVGDDQAETDGDPTRDDANASNGPGRGIVLLRAESFGPFGSHKTIEAAVQRPVSGSLEDGYTGQRGQDEQNRRNRSAVIGQVGHTLAEMKMNLSTGGMVVQ
ncbi:MAG: pilus assembly PilX N-terminal domain-containing protein [Acidobacteria bacterium]|nr:pilus assembly PilX N-terminal domain-containing protein [Acidobacteriota bacterium]